jgi:hypothetical protein
VCVCLCFVRDVFRECCCLCEREKRGRPGLLSTFVLGVCEEGEREREGDREKREGIWCWRGSLASQVLPTQHSMWQGIDKKWEPWLL